MIKVDIRWSDIDANRHLGNSSFMDFMSHARLKFMKKHQLGQKDLARHNVGPVIFYEHIHYFKEVMLEEPVYVDVELNGMSKDGAFFQFRHQIYDQNGQNMATCNLMGAWIDLDQRKIIRLPEDLLEKFQTFEKPGDFKFLTKKDTRKHALRPQAIDPALIKKKLYKEYKF